MSSLTFDQLKITTMTMVIAFTNSVNLDSVYPLLPVTTLDLPSPKRTVRKFKIPHCPIPGSILSLRYKGNVRGIPRSSTNKFFKNSITLDISTKVKNVSIKLSRGKIQMCGASSVEQGKEGAIYLLQHIMDIQENLDLIHEHPLETKRIVDWVKTNTLGDPIDGIYQNHQKECGVRRPVIDVPGNIERQICTFLLDQLDECFKSKNPTGHSKLCDRLDRIVDSEKVCSGPLKISTIDKAMINYNYDLGFMINRQMLVTMINREKGSPFLARHENLIDHNVTVEYPIESLRHVKKKGKNPCCTILVYGSGLVTQSGPSEEIMRQVYDQFNDIIRQIRPYVEKVERVERSGKEVERAELVKEVK